MVVSDFASRLTNRQSFSDSARTPLSIIKRQGAQEGPDGKDGVNDQG
jgi:hypothetical protein